MKCIVWLASYPKSGNTWVRVFLANYYSNTDEPAPINALGKIAYGDSVPADYVRVAGPNFDFNDDAAFGQTRHAALQARIGNPNNAHFFKTHNINAVIGEYPLIPVDLTASAVYIVRNPLDMIISYAAHFGVDIDTAIEAMQSVHNRVVADPGTTTQFLGTWSDHVRTWTSRSQFPVHTMKYEDMLANPKRCFTLMLRKIGLPIEKKRMDKALEFSKFENVKKQEETDGFNERSAKSDRFFRVGRKDQWRDVLTAEQVRAIVDTHGKFMRKFDYVPRS